MSRSIELHVGDVGTEIVISLVDDETAVDLTSLTSAVLKIQRPDQTVIELPTSILGDPTDGVLVSIVTAETFTEAGCYIFQVYTVFGSQKWHSERTTQFVYPVVS